jgi:hypothetical protein
LTVNIENTAGLAGIPLCMRDGWAWSLLLMFLAISSSVFAADGMFQGTIVKPPDQKQAASGWIFVEGRNRVVRRVDVAHAVIVPPAGASSGEGGKCGPECLAVGQEVRVTAEQDASGEWHARRVEILRPASGRGRAIVEWTAESACPYETLPSQDRGCWITVPGPLCIQPLTEKSLTTRWSGGIMNDVL